MEEKSGKILLIHGVMHSGKTQMLLKTYAKTAADSRFLALPYKWVVKVGDAVQEYGSDETQHAIRASYAIQDAKKAPGRATVFIDEAEFLTDVEIDKIEAAANDSAANIDFVIASLEKDYLDRPFPAFQRLCGIATEKREVGHQCEKCLCKAASHNLIVGKDDKAVVQEFDDILIAEDEEQKKARYMSVCDKCATGLGVKNEK